MLIIINDILLTAVNSFKSWNRNIFTIALNSYHTVYHTFDKINEIYTDIFLLKH